MVKVSIIIPVYNVEKYLRECLDSVLNQVFDSYEIICIDDISTDNSRKILEEYANNCSKIRIVSHDVNRGLSAARNTGLKHARGKYILFVDSDDMLVEGALEELYRYAEDNNLDNIYFDYEIKNELGIEKKSNNKIKKEFVDIQRVYEGQELFCMFAKKKEWKIEAWRQFYKREFLENCKCEFYDGILHEDNLFSFICAMQAKRVMEIPKKYYVYRHRNNSIMTTINEKRAESLYIVLMEIFNYWNTHTFSKAVNDAIAEYFEAIYKNLAYYQNYCSKDSELIEKRKPAERKIYQLLKNEKKKYLTLSSNNIRELLNAQHIIVYGAGRGAIDIIQTLQEIGLKIQAVAVSDTTVNARSICGIGVKNISELVEYRKNAAIVIGVTSKYSEEIEKKLKELGFDNVVRPDL